MQTFHSALIIKAVGSNKRKNNVLEFGRKDLAGFILFKFHDRL